MDERAFYTESNTSREAELNCPHCHTTANYGLTWILRKKKDKLPPRADERDRARFAKAQSYMVLMDDKVMCANVQCRKRFDVSGIKTMAFLSTEQEAAIAPAPQRNQQRQGQRSEQRPNQKRPKGKQRRRGNQPEHRAKQGGPGGQQKRRNKQSGGRGDQQPGQKKGQRGDQQPDEQAGQQYDWRTDHFGPQPQQGRKGKRKRPQVYFPSDYVNYRP